MNENAVRETAVAGRDEVEIGLAPQQPTSSLGRSGNIYVADTIDTRLYRLVKRLILRV